MFFLNVLKVFNVLFIYVKDWREFFRMIENEMYLIY